MDTTTGTGKAQKRQNRRPDIDGAPTRHEFVSGLRAGPGLTGKPPRPGKRGRGEQIATATWGSREHRLRDRQENSQAGRRAASGKGEEGAKLLSTTQKRRKGKLTNKRGLVRDLPTSVAPGPREGEERSGAPTAHKQSCGCSSGDEIRSAGRTQQHTIREGRGRQ